MSTSSSRDVLGVSLTPQTVEAVLLRVDSGHPVVVQRFVHPRLRVGDDALSEDFATALPGLKTSEESDFTLQVGTRSQDDPFDGSFGGSDRLSGDGAPSPGRALPRTFAGPLSDIIAECTERGFENLDVVFVAGSPDIAHIEIAANVYPKGPSRSRWIRWRKHLPFGSPAPNAELISALRAAHKGGFDARRVRFFPMTPAPSGTPRHLALVPTPADSVTPTLKTTLARDLNATPVRFDSEVPLHVDAVRRYLEPDTEHITAVVRVGTDDTLILFMAGSELIHVEHPRSLTSYDAPDTLASRVMLYQDEQQIESLDAIVLAGGSPDDRLVDSFRSFFPDAAIGRLHELLSAEHVDGNAEVLNTITPDAGLALAAGLRLVHDRDDAFNLLGVVEDDRPHTMPSFAWHTVLTLILLAATTLFFVWQYVSQQDEITELQTRINANPIALPNISPQDLKTRVDSLNAVHARHARALTVLDSLLMGSAEWSTTLERAANETSDIGGVWFEEWELEDAVITMRGHATDRNRVATLTRNLGGDIHELVYTEIEDKRVYQFEITVPRSADMPAAALYLRERDLDPDAAASITGTPDSTQPSAATSSSGSSPTATSAGSASMRP